MPAFMVDEAIVAIVSGSLALLSDAGYMLADIGASPWAITLAAPPATGVEQEAKQRLGVARGSTDQDAE